VPLTKPQQEVISCEKRFRVLISGRRFGKTFLAINELAKFARFPNQKVWYVSPSYRQSKNICWTMLKEQMIKHKWAKKINDSDLSIVLKNNSLIQLKGADNEQSLRGVGLNFIVLDEFADIKPNAWYEVLRPTLSDTKGSALFCGSPKGFNFAYDLYSRKDKEWKSFKFTTIEGGQVDQEEIEQAKNDLDERTFQQEYLATFVNYAGIIYYNFDINNNVIEDYKLHDGTIHIGMDFNIDPMCCVVAQEKDNKIIIFDEIQIWSSNTAEMVEEIKQRYKQKVVVYPDPASRQRKTSAGGFTDLSILKNAGFEVRCRSTHPLVRDRINAVNSKLKNVNGKSSLFMIKSCKNLIKSLQRQIYKEGTHVPDKDSGFDHFNDALGYMIEYMYPLRRDFKPNRPTRWS
tara:strand:+ start:5690 stop:6895 length:1206 start_codon:yes stop_codon:yes gene_type:complete